MVRPRQARVGRSIRSSSALIPPPAPGPGWSESSWAEAEAAFDEAVVARPLDTAVLLERARFLAAHSPGPKADDDFARAYILGNREPALLDTISSSESHLPPRRRGDRPDSAAPLWAIQRRISREAATVDRGRRGHR